LRNSSWKMAELGLAAVCIEYCLANLKGGNAFKTINQSLRGRREQGHSVCSGFLRWFGLPLGGVRNKPLSLPSPRPTGRGWPQGRVRGMAVAGNFRAGELVSSAPALPRNSLSLILS